MNFKKLFKKMKGGYFFSSDFNNLCECLNLTNDDIVDLRSNVSDDGNLDEIALNIFDKCYKPLSKDLFDVELINELDEVYYNYSFFYFNFYY